MKPLNMRNTGHSYNYSLDSAKVSSPSTPTVVGAQHMSLSILLDACVSKRTQLCDERYTGRDGRSFRNVALINKMRKRSSDQVREDERIVWLIACRLFAQGSDFVRVLDRDQFSVVPVLLYFSQMIPDTSSSSPFSIKQMLELMGVFYLFTL